MSLDLAMKLQAIGRPRCLVIGDYINDISIDCTPHRFAQEAGHCPVYKHERHESRPGGAGAVHAMAHALGADVTIVSGLRQNSASKERYFVNGVQVLRIDRDAEPLTDHRVAEMLAAIAYEMQRADCVLIADYGKGVLTQSVLRAAIEGASTRGIPCLVDPAHGVSWDRYRGCTAVKCNQHEWDTAKDIVHAESNHGQDLKLIFHFQNCIVTNGAHGMHHIGETPTSCKQRNAIDPTGCGDMVLAALGVCIAAGLTWPDVCQIANAAAGLKCERRGAVPVPRAEVVLDLLDGEKRIQRALLPVVRATRQRVVFTNGCFRVCHAGHAWLMRWAKEQGACLVVGVNDDESAANLRPGEYVMPLAERMEIIAGLGCVDYVVPFSEPDPCELLRLLKPDVLVKGGEYAGERIPGDDMVADVRIAPESPYATHATSLIADLIQNQD